MNYVLPIAVPILLSMTVCNIGKYDHMTPKSAHSPTFPSLYLRHSSFSSPSVASPTSQFILQPLFRFSYVTTSSLNSPGELPMLLNTLTVNVNLSYQEQSHSYIMRAATDGCRSRPCLACPPLHGASNCRYSQTLALSFSSVSE